MENKIKASEKEEKKLTFAIFGNTYQPKKSAAIQQLIQLLEDRGASLLIDRDFYDFLTGQLQLDIHPAELILDNHFQADIVISMGGDGTFLKAASRVGNKEIPIVGINMGRLGFLAAIAPEEVSKLVDDLYAGNYDLERRAVLKTSLVDSATGQQLTVKGYPYALNDVAILKHDISSMITVHAWISGQYLATYQADGVVVSTPTGSTAYNLSVGGPILQPASGTIGITPVAPHSLNVRPIVIRDDCKIQLQVESRSHNHLLSIDGRSASYREGTLIQIEKGEYQVVVIKPHNQTFFQTLRQKMMWGADHRD